MSHERTVDVGMVPYWATTSHDGKHCLVSISGDDRIAVLEYATGLQVALVPTGQLPAAKPPGKACRERAFAAGTLPKKQPRPASVQAGTSAP
jgi:hypothetical protein